MGAQDLTSLANVRAMLQKPGSDVGQDGLIGALITRASVAIMRYTDRQFAPAETAATKVFEYEQGGTSHLLDVAPYDLRAITQVQLDTDESSATTLTTDEYRLFPQPPRDGVYTALRLQPFSYGRGRWGHRQVSVTGNWGFASVPVDVEDACIKTVALWLRRDASGFDAGASEGVWVRPLDLPSAVMAALDRYRRMFLG
jgi:hypothetical protein